MRPGQAIRCVVNYDLFGVNLLGEEGCFVKLDSRSGKSLIWFPCNGEWAELEQIQFEAVNKGNYIPKRYKEFIDTVKTLGT